MTDTVVLDFQSAEELPPIEEIVRIAQTTRVLCLQFPVLVKVYSARLFSRNEGTYIINHLCHDLAPLLTDYTAYDAGTVIDPAVEANLALCPDGSTVPGTARMVVLRVITEEEVLIHAEAIVSAARYFRQLAAELMQRLATKLDIPLESFTTFLSLEEPRRVIYTSLDEEWGYWFHGYHCRFSNARTGQQLEVHLAYPNVFGVLAPYFFIEFLETSSDLQPVAKLFDDFPDPTRPLLILERHGRLLRIKSMFPEYSDLIAPL